MKILQISSAESFGGGENHLVQLSKGLLQKGHEIFLAVRPIIDWEDKISFVDERNVFRLPLRNSLDIVSARKLAKIINENDIEIVHAHLARDYFIAALAVRLAPQAKFVLTRHVLFPMNSLHKIALGNLSRAIAVSGSVENELRKVIPSEKITKVYNGIDISHFKNADHDQRRREFRFENNIPFDAPFVGTIGELKILKGQRDFILAAQIIVQKFPEARFAIIGKDNSFKQDFRRELKRMVKVFSLEDHFLWLDWVEDTANVMHALDVFVSASHSESFGLAILEAMASGTPVVSTATEGAKEILATDRLVSIETPKMLADEILLFLENEEKREEFRDRTANRAEEIFSLERMIAETEAIYLEIN